MVVAASVGGNSTKLVGEFSVKPQVGWTFDFEGQIVNHPVYKKQYKVSRGPIFDIDTSSPDAEVTSLMKMLRHLLPTPKPAEKLRDFWVKEGTQAMLESLRSQDGLESAGLTPLEATAVLGLVRKTEGEGMLVDMLGNLSLPPVVRKQIIKQHGSNIKEILKTNPYHLCEVDGFKVAHADAIARGQGIYSADSEERRFGVVMEVIFKALQQGHTCIPVPRMNEILSEMGMNKIPISLIKKSTKVYEFEGLIGLFDIMSQESNCTNMLELRMTSPDEEGAFNKKVQEKIHKALEDVRAGLSLELTDKQRQGVLNALTSRVSVITGLPGTGKTTSLKMLVRVLDVLAVKYTIAAPTGIAAKRVSIVTGAIAGTIHRIFGAKSDRKNGDGGDDSDYFGIRGSAEKSYDSFASHWAYHQGNPYPADLIIIDEASMIDINLLYRILDATHPKTHLVFVGDPAQLPSVGPGNVLSDLIKCNRFPTTSLTDIFRQSDTSDIIRASHDIFHGNYPNYPQSKEFTFVSAKDDADVQRKVVAIAKKLHGSMRQYQILSPCHRGKIGVTAFNETLRDIFNPQTTGVAEKRIGGAIIRVRDRVLITKNNYEYGVFNGDIAKVLSFTEMNEGGKTVPAIEIMIYDDTMLTLTLPMSLAMSTLRLAYAMTVHKFQGLEHEVIVIPVMDSFGVQLQRNLYYTAITRATDRVIIVGNPNALAKAIANTSGMERHTRLQQLLEET